MAPNKEEEPTDRVNSRKSIDTIDRHLLLPLSVNPMNTRRRVPDIRFRVLIIGRANAGKTSILQRICGTTESPIICKSKNGEKREVRDQPFVCESDLIADQVTKLDPSMDVSDNYTSLRLRLNVVPARRAHHRRRTSVLQSPGLRIW